MAGYGLFEGKSSSHPEYREKSVVNSSDLRKLLQIQFKEFLLYSLELLSHIVSHCFVKNNKNYCKREFDSVFSFLPTLPFIKITLLHY